MLAVALVAYSTIANRLPAFNKKWFVPANVTACALVLLYGHLVMNLSTHQIWGPDPPFGPALLGAVAGVALASPLFLIALSKRWAHRIADERVAHLTGRGLLYQTLIRIPLGTALFEEVAFRGVLYPSWELRSFGEAAFISSIAFGLWHVSPTINMVKENRPEASRSVYLRAIVGAVVFTTAVGVAFVMLLEIANSLAAPLFLHATVNALATVAAVIAHRRKVIPGRPR